MLCKGIDHMIADSDHEEADIRIVLHVIDALRRGANKIIIRTVDTVVFIIYTTSYYLVKPRDLRGTLVVHIQM